MANHETLLDVRSAYDTVAEAYSAALPDTSFEAPLDMAMVDHFAAHMRATADRLVIDVGCGTGRMSSYLSRAGLNVSGTIDGAYGHDIQLRAELHAPDDVALRFTEQGFVMRAQLVRAPRAMENHPQAAVLVDKPCVPS